MTEEEILIKKLRFQVEMLKEIIKTLDNDINIITRRKPIKLPSIVFETL